MRSTGADGDNERLSAICEPRFAGRKLHQHLLIRKAVVKFTGLAFLSQYDGSCRHDRQCGQPLHQSIALRNQTSKGISIFEDQRFVVA
ncbi:hypothetical protein D9M69_534760 [compost metagenome]